MIQIIEVETFQKQDKIINLQTQYKLHTTSEKLNKTKIKNSRRGSSLKRKKSISTNQEITS